MNGSLRAAAEPENVGLGGRFRWHLVLAVALMLTCVIGTSIFKPTALWSAVVGQPDLEHIIPNSFGPWELSRYGANVVVNPQQEEALRNIYTNTLARAYVHKVSGRQIMVSVAYGNDQTRDTQLHPPEACYRSQGFRVDRLLPYDLTVPGHTLPAMRMDTVLGTRREYVTYWIRVGDELSRGSLQRNLVRMRFAAKGYIVDGLLFRVSEVTRGTAGDSYAQQDEFIRDLLSNMPPASLKHLVGYDRP